MIDFFEGLYLLIIITLSLIAFLCPFIIAAITGNWWFIFLFAVSWIPAIGILMLGVLIE